jgi:multidrug efflux pump subunit AcrA (membrane-fusion protein)
MPVTKVVVREAAIRQAAPTITLVATVEPFLRSRVCTEREGLVVSVPVRQGDRVRAGDAMCVLNTDTQQLQLAEEQARLDGLASRLDELLAGTRPQEMQRLKALLDETTAEHERWQFEMERIRRLYEGADSNAKEFQDTRASYLGAERRRLAAEATYALAEEGPRSQTIAQARHDVAAQQAIVDRMRSDLDKMTTRAPFDGFIAQRMTEVGEWISVGSTVVELIDLSRVLVTVAAPEGAYPHARVGQQARVEVDALRRSFEGTIRHITPQADLSARTFPIEIEVDNPEGALAAGMFARATIAEGPVRETVCAPKDALVEREGTVYVATVIPGAQGGTAGILMPVTIGVDVSDWVSITSGNIQPGMTLIVRGNERMLPFPMPVQIVDEFGTPVASPTSPTPPARGPAEADVGPHGSRSDEDAKGAPGGVGAATKTGDGGRDHAPSSGS